MEKIISEVKKGLVLLFPAPTKPVQQEPQCELDYNQLLEVATLLHECVCISVVASEKGIAHEGEYVERQRRIAYMSGQVLGLVP